MLWKYLCYAVGLLLGALMLFGGVFVLRSMPALFADKIKSQLPIVRGSEAYTRYTQPAVPLQVKLYLFNVTNPEQVARGEARPRLAQVGPFALTERRRKEVVGGSPDQHTLDYKLVRTYYLNPADSGADLRAPVTMPNAPAFSAIFKAQEKARDEEGAANPVAVLADYLANETMYLTRSADEWLFKGIKLDWLDALNEDGVVLDEQPPDNRFGLYYKKNDTWDQRADGIMTISTGADRDFANIGRVVRWNGKQQVSFWRGPHCNQVRGTDGQFFHPNVQKDELLDIFAPDLCRTLSIQFAKTTSIRSIELYRFGIADSFFKPIDTSEETRCYCVKRSHESKQKFCKLAAVVDVSSCRKSPIVLSTPHFYNGDPSLAEAVDGLQASQADHDTFIDIEPMTGAVLRVRRRLQVNLEMTASEGFRASEPLAGRRLVHPFVWLDQAVTVPDELAQKLENKLTKIVRMVRILCYAALITGPIILVATFIFILRDLRAEDDKLRQAQSKAAGAPDAPTKLAGDYQKVHVIMKTMAPARD